MIRKIDSLPLKLLIIYVTIGVSLSFWGPIEYKDYDKLVIYAYISSFLFIFSIFYLYALHEFKEVIIFNKEDKLKKFFFWVKLCILIITFRQFVDLFISIANGTLSFSLSEMGNNYINAYKDYERGTGNISISFLIQTLTYVPYLVTLILGSFYYKIMVLFVFISIILLETITYGKQKQLGDIFIFIILTQILTKNLSLKKTKIFRKVIIIAFFGFCSLNIILYFRYEALGIDINSINNVVHPLMEYNHDHIFFKLFGDTIGLSLSIFSGYLSQGYYGLSLSMKEPFVWTFFIGNSYSITVFLNKFLGIDVNYKDTYPYRASLSTGWDDTKWSTIFAWFAGDFTFLGTLFIFAIFAFLFAKLWIEAYRYKNPISIVLFSLFSIVFIYIPANNQLFHTPGSVIAFFYFFILWLFNHKKYNFGNEPK